MTQATALACLTAVDCSGRIRTLTESSVSLVTNITKTCAVRELNLTRSEAARCFNSRNDFRRSLRSRQKMRPPGIEPEPDGRPYCVRTLRLVGFNFPPAISSLRSEMRRPGIEPGLEPWEGSVLPLDQRRPVETRVSIQINHTIRPTSTRLINASR